MNGEAAQEVSARPCRWQEPPACRRCVCCAALSLWVITCCNTIGEITCSS